MGRSTRGLAICGRLFLLALASVLDGATGQESAQLSIFLDGGVQLRTIDASQVLWSVDLGPLAPGVNGRGIVGLTTTAVAYDSQEALQLRTLYMQSSLTDRPLEMWYHQWNSASPPGLEPVISKRADSLEEIRWSATSSYGSGRTFQVTGRAYILRWRAYSNMVQYIVRDKPDTAGERVYLCEPVVEASRYTLNANGDPVAIHCKCSAGACAANSLPVELGVLQQQDVRGAGHMIITLPTGLDVDTKDAFYAVAIEHMTAWRNMRVTAQILLESNDKRKEGARNTTAVLLTFVALGMLLVSIVMGIILGWAIQPVPSGGMKEKLGLTSEDEAAVFVNTLVFTAVAVVTNFLVSATAGFTGWFLVGAIYSFTCMIFGCIGCVQRARKNNCCGSNVKVSAVTTKPDEGTETIEAAEVEAVSKWPGEGLCGCWCSHPQRWARFGSCCDNQDPRVGQMGRRQEYCLWVNVILFFLFFFMCLIVVYAWEIEDYKIIRRETQDVEIEIIPPVTAKAVQFMYAWDGLATNLKLQIYTKWLTQWCGRTFKRKLGEGEKDSEIRDAFLVKYQLDMSEYTPVDYRAYDSVNSWFIRHLAPYVRPVAGERLAPTADGWSAATPAQRDASPHPWTVVSPADCRMLIYPSIEHARVWIKGSRFNYHELVGEREQYRYTFAGGTMVIARLAPQDYHRFNSPISGQIEVQYDLDGTYWSVNADAARSKNYAFYNLRRVIIVKYTNRAGVEKRMAYVAIGATCVGSVVFTGPGQAWSPGDNITKGQEFGFMQFGGSTVILLFQEGEFAGDEDMLANSDLPVETYVRVKERIGMLKTPG